MSNFLRDLAIAKFPRFGIDYYVQLVDEPEIYGSSIKATLQFYDGKTTPPTALSQRTVKLPLWKWGDYVDIIEAEIFSENRHIIAVQLEKRRPDDEYGSLRIQIDKQVTLDALNRDQPPTESGPSKPAAVGPHGQSKPEASNSERGQPAAGGEESPTPPANPPSCNCKSEAICQETPRGIICIRCGGWV